MNQSFSVIFPPDSPYRQLAHKLDSLPNRFPPADDESDLQLLAKLFTPREADLTANLSEDYETLQQISQRLDWNIGEVNTILKDMSQKGLISVGKTAQGRLGFKLLPFVVGIYENQLSRMDAELAQLFENYYTRAFGKALEKTPQFHRVIPVGKSLNKTLEIRPYESVYDLIDQAQAWAVGDCICRVQKSLIGEPCGHPLDVCLILSDQTHAFDGVAGIRVLNREEAIQTLQRAAEAGLVHTVSNNQKDIWYICNCCTCSCGILRGMVDLGIANVVAYAAYISQVNQDLCINCGECLPYCQFGALVLTDTIQIIENRCAGCGICTTKCPQGALSLVQRIDEIIPPMTSEDWRKARHHSSEHDLP